jgi:predicted negative regulator of RcsB-dependent stress response
VAGLYLDLGKLDLAKAAASQSVDAIQSLVALDSSNFFWLNMLCEHRLRLALIELSLGERDAAGELLQQVSPDIDRLLARDSAALEEHVGVRGELLALKSKWEVAGGQPAPVAAMQAYLTEVAALEAAGKRLSVDRNNIVATVALALGDELARQGKAGEARETWLAARKRLSAAETRGGFEELTLRGLVESRLGQMADASALAERLRRSNYRHPAYAELNNSLVSSAGGAQPRPDH